jgi:hypothetical protein
MPDEFRRHQWSGLRSPSIEPLSTSELQHAGKAWRAHGETRSLRKQNATAVLFIAEALSRASGEREGPAPKACEGEGAQRKLWSAPV